MKRQKSKQKDKIRLDCLIVLGQSLNADGSEPVTLTNRVRTARELCISQSIPVLCTGGDPAGVGISEAEVMKRSLVAAGVPEDMVITETASLTTLGNAFYCYDILVAKGWTRIGLATSDFHLPRSLIYFESVFIYRTQRENNANHHFELTPFPAPCGLPLKGGTGAINNWGLKDRLELEVAFLTDGVPRQFLSHAPTGHTIPPPSEDKIKAAREEVKAMLARAQL